MTTVTATPTADVVVPNTNNEAFDEEGNTTQVANLHFIHGVLGQGAYGTVRLARRRLITDSKGAVGSVQIQQHDINKQQQQQHTHQQQQYKYRSPSTPQPLLPPTQNRRPRRYPRLKSSSAPAGDDFFKLPIDEDISSNSDHVYSNGNGEYHEHPRHHLSARKAHPGFLSIKKCDRLGRSFSEADSLKSKNAPSEHLVAVKIFRKSLLKRMRTMERNKETRKVQIKTGLQRVEREIALMKKLSHPNLVLFYEAIDSPDSDMLYMVIEYMPLGEILTYQNDGTFRRKEPKSYQEPLDGLVDGGHFDEYHAALYFVDIMHGLAYLHQHHIAHLDLKPENVLLDARGVAKLGDFGVSHYFDDNKQPETPRNGINSEVATSALKNGKNNASFNDSIGDTSHSDSFSECNDHYHHHHHSAQGLTRQDTDMALEMKPMAHDGLMTKTEGTWAFWSPEMCEGKSYSGYAADIWAAGVCLYIFVTGKLPFYSETPTELFDQIKAAKIPLEGLNLSESFVDLLKITLHPDPEQRAGVGDCLKHPALLLARAHRIRQLSVEFAKSKATNTKVEERDIQAAFRIVTSMPAVLLRSATRQIQEGIHAARTRLSLGSMGRSRSFSDRFNRSFDESDKTPNCNSNNNSISNSNSNRKDVRRKHLFDGHSSVDQLSFGAEDSPICPRPNKVVGTGRALSLVLDENESCGDKDESISHLDSNFCLMPQSPVRKDDDIGRTGRNSFSNFFTNKRRSFQSSDSELEFPGSRIPSFLRHRKSSDLSRDSDSANGEIATSPPPATTTTTKFWGRKRSDVSNLSVDDSDDERLKLAQKKHHERGMGIFRKFTASKRDHVETEPSK